MKSMNSLSASMKWALALTAITALGVLPACTKNGGGERGSTAASAPSADQEALSAGTMGEPDRAAELGPVLEAYDRIHGQLVKDQIEAAVQSAGDLQAAADAAAGLAPPRLQPHLNALADAAAKLRAAPVGDPGAVRMAFGEVSKPMVELLSAAPEAREGWHVFECPMSKGYHKWVQSSGELRNPYMGTRMAKCGHDAEWTSGG